MGFQNGGGTATGKGPRLHRANGGNPPGEQHPTEQARNDDDDDDDAGGVFAALQELQSGGRIALWRIAPTWAAGFLCTMESTEPLDLEQVRREFGGGTYSARPMAQNKRGSFRFKPGAVRFQIVGAPLIEGRLAQPQQPQPSRAIAPDAVVTRGGAVHYNQEGVIERLLDEMAQMRTQFAAVLQQQAQALPATTPATPAPSQLGGSLAGLATQMRELKKVRALLREIVDDDDDGDDGDDAGDDNGSAAASLEERLLSKIFEEEKPKAAAPAQASSKPQPRLIRAGSAAPARAEEQPRAAPPPPPPPDHANSADLGGAEDTPEPEPSATVPTAASIFQQLQQLTPEEGQRLLLTVAAQVPPGVLRALADRAEKSRS